MGNTVVVALFLDLGWPCCRGFGGGAMKPSEVVINIAADFSPVPGGRHARLGPFSGEEFRAKVLAPALRKALAAGSRVNVVLDGAAGYPVSFLEEAFGGLVRIEGFSFEQVKQALIITALAQRFQVRRDLAWRYIEEARAQNV